MQRLEICTASHPYLACRPFPLVLHNKPNALSSAAKQVQMPRVGLFHLYSPYINDGIFVEFQKDRIYIVYIWFCPSLQVLTLSIYT